MIPSLKFDQIAINKVTVNSTTEELNKPHQYLCITSLTNQSNRFQLSVSGTKLLKLIIKKTQFNF